MAGIGFELLKMLRQDNYTSLLRAYGLTTMMVSGPYIFILFTLSTLHFFAVFATHDAKVVHQLTCIMVYLLSCGILVSSFMQLSFFRFVADRIFEKDFASVTPNYVGVLLVQFIISLCFACAVIFYFLSSYHVLLKILFVSTIVVLSMIFISIVLLTGLKSYRKIISAFLFSYSSLLIMHFIIHKYDLVYLLIEFLITQTMLLLFLANDILRHYPTNDLIAFRFLKRANFYYSVGFANLFYTLGFWIDKYLFWFNPVTSMASFPPLRYSPIYDFPMLIAYLTIIPTTATFLLQVETSFSMVYPKFMIKIFRRKTLAEIDAIRNELTIAGRNAMFSLFRTQAVIIVTMFLITPFFLSYFHLPDLYINLLYILYVAAGLNVILWGLLNILYYTTRYKHALYVSLIFCVSNFSLTMLGFHLGPAFYGYGYGFSLLIAIAVALVYLNANFKDLTYTTFMMTD